MNPPANLAPEPAAQPVLPGQPTDKPTSQPTGHTTGQPMNQPVQEYMAWAIATYTNLGPYPISMTCPHCGTEIRTRVEPNTPATAWILGLVICAFG